MPNTTARRGRTRARVAVATALALLGTTAVGSLTSPASAAVGAPGSLVVSLANSSTPVLSWTRPEGVTEFSLQMDNDPSFGSTEVNENTRNTRYVPTKNLSRGTQYWRVRAAKDGKYSAWATGSFNVSPVSVPVGTYPADGAVLPQPDSPPLLRWQTSRGATSYTVEVDGDADFIGAKSWTTKTTSLAVPDALPAGDYFWRVTASLEGGYNSTPSPTMSFVLGALPSPQLTYPLDDINQAVEDVVFDWEPVPGAVTYDLQVATDSTFNNFAYKAENLYGSRYSPPTTLFNDQFWWRVRAVDLAGQPTAWSTARFSFQRDWLDTPRRYGRRARPRCADASVAEHRWRPVFFQWTPVQHASRYELAVATDRNFSAQVSTLHDRRRRRTRPRTGGDCTFAAGDDLLLEGSPARRPLQRRAPRHLLGHAEGQVGCPEPDRGAARHLRRTGCGAAGRDDWSRCHRRRFVRRARVRCLVRHACALVAEDVRCRQLPDLPRATTRTSRRPRSTPLRSRTTNNVFALREGDAKRALAESEAGKPYFWFVRPCWSRRSRARRAGPTRCRTTTPA